MSTKKTEVKAPTTEINSVLPQDIKAEMENGNTAAPVVDTTITEALTTGIDPKEMVSLDCSHAVIKIGNIYYPSRDGKVSIPKAFEDEAKKILGA